MLPGLSLPPNFFDWADGTPNFGGTPTPIDAYSLSQQGSNDPNTTFEEHSDSPQIEFGEQGTVKHSFRMSYQRAISYSLGLKRGTILQDSNGNYSRVLSTSINRVKPDMADLIVVAESLMTDDVPPDEFSIDPIEFSPAIQKHPRYFIYDPFSAGVAQSGPPSTIGNPTPYVILTPYDLFLCRNYIQGSEFFTQQNFLQLIGNIPNANDPYGSQTTAFKRNVAAQELVQKMLLGIESPYIPAFRVTFSKYFFYGQPALGGANVNPQLNPGGFIQDPTDIIPPQYWSVDGSGAAFTNILLPIILGGAMDTTLCPTFYNRGISWLREADSVQFQRTWFRKTSVWIGGPVGQWDPDVYSQFPSPYLP
jgi:hypothetical protein